MYASIILISSKVNRKIFNFFLKAYKKLYFCIYYILLTALFYIFKMQNYASDVFNRRSQLN